MHARLQSSCAKRSVIRYRDREVLLGSSASRARQLSCSGGKALRITAPSGPLFERVSDSATRSDGRRRAQHKAEALKRSATDLAITGPRAQSSCLGSRSSRTGFPRRVDSARKGHRRVRRFRCRGAYFLIGDKPTTPRTRRRPILPRPLSHSGIGTANDSEQGVVRCPPGQSDVDANRPIRNLQDLCRKIAVSGVVVIGATAPDDPDVVPRSQPLRFTAPVRGTACWASTCPAR